MAQLVGIVLAAGAGSRSGGAKALRRDAEGVPWAALAVGALAACDRVVVVLGAAAAEARSLVPPSASVAVAADWATGLSASLRVGLTAGAGADAALVTLVDLPGLPAAAVDRVLAPGVAPGVLRRAVYGGRPGHPVLLGADHWSAALAAATGDSGAGGYLSERGADLIECGDLWDGRDLDRREPDRG